MFSRRIGRSRSRAAAPYVAAALAMAAATLPGLAGLPSSTASATPPVHPSLLFSAADVAGLRAKIASGPPAQAWANLKQKVDAWSDPTNPQYKNPAIVDPPVNGDQGQNQMGTTLTDLGFAYQLTGNAAYAADAIALMRHLAVDGWPAWGSGSNGANRAGEIGNDLGHGDLAAGVAMAFDWTYDAMTQDDRNVIVNSIASEITYATGHPNDDGAFLHCIYGTPNGTGWLTPGNNWTGVCAGGEGLLMLAVNGENALDTTTGQNNAKTMLLKYLKQYIGANGDGAEGATYTLYGLHNSLPFMLAWNRVFPTDNLVSQVPGLTNVGAWMTYEQLPGGGPYWVPRNDSAEGLALESKVIPNLFAIRNDGLTAWLFDHSIGDHGDKSYGNCNQPTEPVIDLFCQAAGEAFTILYWQSTAPVDPGTVLAPAQRYTEKGLVDYRTGWAGGAAELTGTFEARHDSPGHTQADLGQFSLYGYGSRFAMDSGYGHNYSCNAVSGAVQGCSEANGKETNSGQASGHNVVQVACGGANPLQDPDGSAKAGETILGYQAAPNFTFVRSDLSHAYYGTVTAQRDLLFSRVPGAPVLLAVTDGVKLQGPHNYCWDLHTDGVNAVAFTGPQQATIVTPTGAVAALAVAETGGPAPVLHPIPYDAAAYAGDAEPQTIVRSEQLGSVPIYDHLAVMAITPAAPATTVTPLTASGGELIGATWAGGEALFASRALQSTSVSSTRLQTDGGFASVMVGKGETVLDLGTTLTVDGLTYATASAGPATIVVSGSQITASGPTGATYTARAPQTITTVTVNGTAVNSCRTGAVLSFPC